jgi:hypothetical protein
MGLLFFAIIGARSLSFLGSASDALSQREDYDSSFAETMLGNIEGQQTAIDSAKDDLTALSQIPNLADPARAKIATIQRSLEAAIRLNQESRTSLRNWIEAEDSLQVGRLDMNLSPISIVHAEVWHPKKGKRPKPRAETVQSQPPPAKSERIIEFEHMTPLLWAFILIPSLFGLIAIFMVGSANARVQDFAIVTVAVVIGYLGGLGSAAYAHPFG